MTSSRSGLARKLQAGPPARSATPGGTVTLEPGPATVTLTVRHRGTVVTLTRRLGRWSAQVSAQGELRAQNLDDALLTARDLIARSGEQAAAEALLTRGLNGR